MIIENALEHSVTAPVRESEQIVPTQTVVSTETMVAAEGGNFVVAGTSGPAAWARKLSKGGVTIWEHASVPTGTLQASHRVPRYFGAAPMPNGGTFLCGIMPHPPQSSDSSAILTHVDAHGNLTSETAILPQTPVGTQLKNIFFQTCAPLGDHVLVKGVALKVTDGAAPGAGTYLHWFVVADTTGKVIWEREVPQTPGLTPFLTGDGNVLLPIGSEIYFSNTDNARTELLRLSISGVVLGRITVDGPFRLVRSMQATKEVELWGMARGQARLIHFSRELKQVGELTGSLASSMSTSLAYKLGDGSLALFGSNVHDSEQIVRPAVARVDSSLHSIKIYEPSWKGARNAIANLPAVAPFGQDGDFMSAVGLSFKAGGIASATASPNDKAYAAGLALDVLRMR